MKLCRFVLTADPGHPRSGVFHDGKVYETDGELAVGIHEPGTLSLLSPLGTPPIITVVENARTQNGELYTGYRYANPSSIAGPNGEIEVIGRTGLLDVSAYVAFVVSDTGAAIEPHEAPTFVLGYTIVLFLCDDELAQHERTLGVGTSRSHDFGTAIGPYLTTPEDLAEFSLGSDSGDLVWNYRLRVNEKVIATGTIEGHETAPRTLCMLSANRHLRAGEVVAFAALEKPSVESVIERPLMGGDRVEVTVDGLGALVVHIT